LLGAAGLAAANQVYNAFKASGKALGDGDVTIVDVSGELKPTVVPQSPSRW
jgi:sulfide:quinone oxidoreductase